MIFVEQLLNGLTLGGIYALIALGYTLVYGVLRMINFAHSELFMVGAVIGWGLLSVGPLGGSLPLSVSIPLVFVLAMAGSGLCGVILNRVAYAPLRRSERLTPLLSAIGASLVLQNMVFLWRDSQLAFPSLGSRPPLLVGGIRLNISQLLIIVVSVVLMVVLSLFVQKTRWGKALRAVSQDPETAQLMGIPVGWLVGLTFFIGGALGGAAGVLNGLYYGSIKYNMGFTPGIKAFTAAVLGGIGSVPGAMLGGFLLGMVESLGAGFLPRPEWKDVFAFVVLMVVLIVRPSGLLGKNVDEKV
jgi:branched-chain amino acid transport system permease protein